MFNENTENSVIREIWTVGLVRPNLVVLACVLRATTKKKVVNFFGVEKFTPEKILATPMCICVLVQILLAIQELSSSHEFLWPSLVDLDLDLDLLNVISVM